MKIVAESLSLKPLSSEFKDNLCNTIPLNPIYVLSKNMKINCHFSAVKNRCILHRRVFVMGQKSI